jgi:hypothetical protein
LPQHVAADLLGNSHYCFRGTFIMQTFGAACERMPNICYQPPMRAEGIDLSL